MNLKPATLLQSQVHLSSTEPQKMLFANPEGRFSPFETHFIQMQYLLQVRISVKAYH